MSATPNSVPHCYSNAFPFFVDSVFNELEPCGPVNGTHPVVTCCQRGDNCYTGGICRQAQADTNGFYVSGCTDMSFPIGICNPSCNGTGNGNGELSTFIDFNITLERWFCSPTNNSDYPYGLSVEFSQPSNTSAEGPDPNAMVNFYTVPLQGPSTPLPAWSHGLSKGAKAGIGVGVVLAVIAIAGALGWILVIRRRKRQQPTKSNTSIDKPTDGPAQLDAEATKKGVAQLEAEDTSPTEMPGSRLAAELPPDTHPVELEGSEMTPYKDQKRDE